MILSRAPKIPLSRIDLISLRRSAVDRDLYIDVLLEWMEGADEEIHRLRTELERLQQGIDDCRQDRREGPDA